MINWRLFVRMAIVSAFAFSSFGSSAADGPPIRIGYSMSNTGFLAQAMPDQVNVYQLWKEQVNARGGLDIGGGKKRLIEFVEYDNQSKPEVAVRIYEKLITDDKVDLLIAPWGTPFHIAIAPILEKHKFPMVGNTAASVKVREVKAGYIWFPTSAIPDRMAVELVKLLKANNVKTAVILSNILPFTKEIKGFLEPELKKAGIDVKLNTEYPPDIKDMTSVLIQVKQLKPDAVLALAYPGDSILYSKQAKELGIDSPFQFVAVGPSASSYQAAIGASANNIVTIGHWVPDRAEWKNAKAFNDAYVKKFKEQPDYLNSALAWMSLEILEQAVAKAGLDKQKLREAIANGTFETINGKVKFNGVENTVTPTAFLQIQRGMMKLIWPPSVATGTFHPKTGW